MLQILITALLSGLFSGIVAFGLNERKERLSQRLGKMEELLIVFTEWTEVIIKYYGRVFGWAQMHLPPDFENDDRVLQGQIEQRVARVRALFYIYADQDQSVVAPVANIMKQMVEVWKDASLAHYAKDHSAALKSAMEMAPHLHALVAAQFDGISVLSTQARRIAARPYLFDRLLQRVGIGSSAAVRPLR